MPDPAIRTGDVTAHNWIFAGHRHMLQTMTNHNDDEDEELLRKFLEALAAEEDTDPLAAIRSRFAPGWEASVLYGQPGWHALIAELDAALVEVMPDIRYFQIKQKYGTLRVYAEQSDPKVDELIREAEQRAEQTCEKCGSAGRLRQRRISRWLKTLCDGCAEAQGYGEVNRRDW